MIAAMLSNKKLNQIITELLSMSLAFIVQYYFAVPINIRLNSTRYFIMKTSNKRELQQMVYNHSSDIAFKGFLNLYKKCNAKPYSFLVIDAILASDNSSHFKKNLLERI